VTYFTEYSKSSISKPLTIAKDFIKGNFQKDISVTDIAEAAGVSQSLIYQNKGAESFRCRSRGLVLVGVQRYAREPKRG